MNLLAPPKRSIFLFQLLKAGLIGAAVVLPFGLQIGRLGLYGDDWSTILFPKTSGSYFSMGSLAKTTIIQFAGAQPILYHLTTIILLFIIGLLLQRVLLQMGLDRVTAVTSVILFLLFPGFLQPASGLAIYPILIGLIFTILSVLSLLEWQGPSVTNNKFGIIGLVCSTCSILISTYTAVLLSFTFLIIIARWQKIPTGKKTLSATIGAGLFLGGLATVLLEAPKKETLDASILIRAASVWMDAFVVSWRQVLAVPLEGSKTILYLLVLLIACFGLIWSFRKIERAEIQDQEQSNSSNTIADIGILICSMLAGFGYIFLILITGLSLEIHYPNDVGMIILGIMAAIIVCLGIKLILLPKYRIAVFAILIVLSAGARYSLVGRYVSENSKVEDMLAQMAVRGDYLEAGSMLISEQLPFDFTAQTSIDALIRNRFKVDKRDSAVTYISADQPEVRDFLQNERQKKATFRMGDVEISVNKERLIGAWIAPGGCLQILNGNNELSGLPQGLRLVAALSKPELLVATNLSDVKQLNQFRYKIEKDWCFYFQLASRQAAEKKWTKVFQTYKIAEGQGLTPESFIDFLPLLSSSIREKQFLKSIELSKELISDPEQKDIICNLWEDFRIESNMKEEVISEVERAKTTIGCS